MGAIQRKATTRPGDTEIIYRPATTSPGDMETSHIITETSHLIKRIPRANPFEIWSPHKIAAKTVKLPIESGALSSKIKKIDR